MGHVCTIIKPYNNFNKETIMVPIKVSTYTSIWLDRTRVNNIHLVT